jgi:hypothetical protein
MGVETRQPSIVIDFGKSQVNRQAYLSWVESSRGQSELKRVTVFTDVTGA